MTALTDFEYRVWEQTKLSSDDFGVMPFTSTLLRAENIRLRKATEKQVFDALSRLASLELLIVFEHQGEQYCCAPQWQKWQMVRFPRKTARPKPTEDVLAKCEPLTVELFTKWPGGKKFKEPAPVSASAREVSEVVTNQSRDKDENSHGMSQRLIPADANANADANASVRTSQKPDLGFIHQPRGVIPRYDPNVYRWGKVQVMTRQHAEFRTRLGGDDADARLEAFYGETEARWEASGVVPGGSCFVVWQREFDAAFATPAASGSVADANRAAAAAFLKGGAQ